MNAADENYCPRCGTVFLDAEKVCHKCALVSLFDPPTIGDDSDTELKNATEFAHIPEDSLPGYRIERFVARGGMGIIFKATHLALDRPVAIKVLGTSGIWDESGDRRFRAEAKTLAELNHPNIVHIYDYGAWENRPFIAMRWVDGAGLNDWINDGKLRPKVFERGALNDYLRKVVPLIQQSALAIHHAHKRGFLHRDLKPANILVDGGGNALVSDFGLARNLEQSTRLTISGHVLGTPGYMPPEQASGEFEAMSPAADVYSLSAVLYWVITGAAPFTGDTALAVLRKVCDADPIPPTETQPSLDADLESICMKGLQKQPRDRYPDANSFAEDLARWLSGNPVAATRTSPRNQAREQRVKILASIIAVAAMIMALTLMWPAPEPGPGDTFAPIVPKSDAPAERALPAASPALLIAHGKLRLPMPGAESGLYVSRIVFDSKEERFVTIRKAPGRMKWTVTVWESFSTNLFGESEVEMPEVKGLEFHPTKPVFLLNGPGKVYLSRGEAPEKIAQFGDEIRGVRVVGFTQDGESVVLTIGGTMEIMNLEGEVVGANEIGGRSFWARTSRRFNQLYVVGGAGDMMRVSLPDLTMEQRRPVATQRTPGNADRDMLGGLSPDERWIGLYTQSQSLQWIPIDDKGEIGSPQRSEIFPRVLRFSRSGRRFAVVTTNEEVWIGTLQDESPGVSVQLPGKGFADAAFAREGKLLVTVSYDGNVRFWDGETGSPAFSPIKLEYSLSCLAVTADAGHVIVGDEMGATILSLDWNAAGDVK